MNCNKPYKRKRTKRLWAEPCRWAMRGEPGIGERRLRECCHGS